MQEYWEELIRRHGRHILYVDTGAIIGALDEDQNKFSEFFTSNVGYHFVTSTYVVTDDS